MSRRTTALIAAAVVLVSLISGCSDGDGDGVAIGGTGEPSTTSTPVAPPEPTEPPVACDPARPSTLVEGRLTVATGEPAFEPWFVDDDPANGRGYESAVVYAVARQMGFAPEAVVWTRAGFDAGLAPGTTPFDLYVQQVEITPEHDRFADLSDPYYDVEQAVVGSPDGPLADASSSDDLRGAKVGVVLGTDGAAMMEQAVGPDGRVRVFDDVDAAGTALAEGRIDGLVVDLPTAHRLTQIELPGDAVLATLAPTGEHERFGFLAVEDSGLIGCVNAALAALRKDGTLAGLQRTWLHRDGAVPTLS